MYNPDSTHDPLAPSPELGPSDSRPGPSPYRPQDEVQPSDGTQTYPAQPQPPYIERFETLQQTQQQRCFTRQEQTPIMSSHDDPNEGYEEDDGGEMDRIRARFNRHTSRLDNMRTLSFGQRTEGGRRVRLVQEEEGKEYHKEHKEEEEGGDEEEEDGELQEGSCPGRR